MNVSALLGVFLCFASVKESSSGNIIDLTKDVSIEVHKVNNKIPIVESNGRLYVPFVIRSRFPSGFSSTPFAQKLRRYVERLFKKHYPSSNESNKTNPSPEIDNITRHSGLLSNANNKMNMSSLNNSDIVGLPIILSSQEHNKNKETVMGVPVDLNINSIAGEVNVIHTNDKQDGRKDELFKNSFTTTYKSTKENWNKHTIKHRGRLKERRVTGSTSGNPVQKFEFIVPGHGDITNAKTNQTIKHKTKLEVLHPRTHKAKEKENTELVHPWISKTKEKRRKELKNIWISKNKERENDVLEHPWISKNKENNNNLINKDYKLVHTKISQHKEKETMLASPELSSLLGIDIKDNDNKKNSSVINSNITNPNDNFAIWQIPVFVKNGTKKRTISKADSSNVDTRLRTTTSQSIDSAPSDTENKIETNNNPVNNLRSYPTRVNDLGSYPTPNNNLGSYSTRVNNLESSSTRDKNRRTHSRVKNLGSYSTRNNHLGSYPTRVNNVGPYSRRDNILGLYSTRGKHLRSYSTHDKNYGSYSRRRNNQGSFSTHVKSERHKIQKKRTKTKGRNEKYKDKWKELLINSRTAATEGEQTFLPRQLNDVHIDSVIDDKTKTTVASLIGNNRQTITDRRQYKNKDTTTEIAINEKAIVDKSTADIIHPISHGVHKPGSLSWSRSRSVHEPRSTNNLHKRRPLDENSNHHTAKRKRNKKEHIDIQRNERLKPITKLRDIQRHKKFKSKTKHLHSFNSKNTANGQIQKKRPIKRQQSRSSFHKIMNDKQRAMQSQSKHDEDVKRHNLPKIQNESKTGSQKFKHHVLLRSNKTKEDSMNIDFDTKNTLNHPLKEDIMPISRGGHNANNEKVQSRSKAGSIKSKVSLPHPLSKLGTEMNIVNKVRTNVSIPTQRERVSNLAALQNTNFAQSTRDHSEITHQSESSIKEKVSQRLQPTVSKQETLRTQHTFERHHITGPSLPDISHSKDKSGFDRISGKNQFENEIQKRNEEFLKSGQNSWKTKLYSNLNIGRKTTFDSSHTLPSSHLMETNEALTPSTTIRTEKSMQQKSGKQTAIESTDDDLINKVRGSTQHKFSLKSGKAPSKLPNNLPSTQRTNQNNLPSTQRTNQNNLPSTQRTNQNNLPSTQRTNQNNLPSTQRTNQNNSPSTQRTNQNNLPSTQRRNQNNLPSTQRTNQNNLPSTQRTNQNNLPSTQRRNQNNLPSTQRTNQNNLPSTRRTNQNNLPSTQRTNQNNLPSTQRTNQNNLPSTQRTNQNNLPSLQRTNQNNLPSTQRTNQNNLPSTQRRNQNNLPSTQRTNQNNLPSTQRRNQNNLPSTQRTNQNNTESTTSKIKSVTMTTHNKQRDSLHYKRHKKKKKLFSNRKLISKRLHELQQSNVGENPTSEKIASPTSFISIQKSKRYQGKHSMSKTSIEHKVKVSSHIPKHTEKNIKLLKDVRGTKINRVSVKKDKVPTFEQNNSIQDGQGVITMTKSHFVPSTKAVDLQVELRNLPIQEDLRNGRYTKNKKRNIFSEIQSGLATRKNQVENSNLLQKQKRFLDSRSYVNNEVKNVKSGRQLKGETRIRKNNATDQSAINIRPKVLKRTQTTELKATNHLAKIVNGKQAAISKIGKVNTSGMTKIFNSSLTSAKNVDQTMPPVIVPVNMDQLRSSSKTPDNRSSPSNTLSPAHSGNTRQKHRRKMYSNKVFKRKGLTKKFRKRQKGTSVDRQISRNKKVMLDKKSTINALHELQQSNTNLDGKENLSPTNLASTELAKGSLIRNTHDTIRKSENDHRGLSLNKDSRERNHMILRNTPTVIKKNVWNSEAILRSKEKNSKNDQVPKFEQLAGSSRKRRKFKSGNSNKHGQESKDTIKSQVVSSNKVVNKQDERQNIGKRIQLKSGLYAAIIGEIQSGMKRHKHEKQIGNKQRNQSKQFVDRRRYLSNDFENNKTGLRSADEVQANSYTPITKSQMAKVVNRKQIERSINTKVAISDMTETLNSALTLPPIIVPVNINQLPSSPKRPNERVSHSNKLVPTNITHTGQTQQNNLDNKTASTGKRLTKKYQRQQKYSSHVRRNHKKRKPMLNTLHELQRFNDNLDERINLPRTNPAPKKKTMKPLVRTAAEKDEGKITLNEEKRERMPKVSKRMPASLQRNTGNSVDMMSTQKYKEDVWKEKIPTTKQFPSSSRRRRKLMKLKSRQHGREIVQDVYSQAIQTVDFQRGRQTSDTKEDLQSEMHNTNKRRDIFGEIQSGFRRRQLQDNSKNQIKRQKFFHKQFVSRKRYLENDFTNMKRGRQLIGEIQDHTNKPKEESQINTIERRMKYKPLGKSHGTQMTTYVNNKQDEPSEITRTTTPDMTSNSNSIVITNNSKISRRMPPISVPTNIYQRVSPSHRQEENDLEIKTRAAHPEIKHSLVSSRKMSKSLQPLKIKQNDSPQMQRNKPHASDPYPFLNKMFTPSSVAASMKERQEHNFMFTQHMNYKDENNQEHFTNTTDPDPKAMHDYRDIQPHIARKPEFEETSHTNDYSFENNEESDRDQQGYYDSEAEKRHQKRQFYNSKQPTQNENPASHKVILEADSDDDYSYEYESDSGNDEDSQWYSDEIIDEHVPVRENQAPYSYKPKKITSNSAQLSQSRSHTNTFPKSMPDINIYTKLSKSRTEHTRSESDGDYYYSDLSDEYETDEDMYYDDESSIEIGRNELQSKGFAGTVNNNIIRPGKLAINVNNRLERRNQNIDNKDSDSYEYESELYSDEYDDYDYSESDESAANARHVDAYSIHQTPNQYIGSEILNAYTTNRRSIVRTNSKQIHPRSLASDNLYYIEPDRRFHSSHTNDKVPCNCNNG